MFFALFSLMADDLEITTGRACISIDFKIVRISCGYDIYVREPQGFSPFCWVTQADCRAERIEMWRKDPEMRL